jgi:hypothetical protein
MRNQQQTLVLCRETLIIIFYHIQQINLPREKAQLPWEKSHQGTEYDNERKTVFTATYGCRCGVESVRA